MSDERGTSDDSTRFAAGRGADDETRFTGVGARAPAAGGKPEATFPPGSVIGHTYRIDAFLARGGMGEVYRARHVELNTDHAIKIILPELANNQRIVDLFRREAAVLRNVRHDAVVAYDGVFRDENGRLYLVMEFADGPSLSKLMHDRPLNADEVRQLRDRLADGLAVAHDRGVVHRDISPDNVILPGGDLGKAKIIDFGISKAVDPEVKTIIGDDFAGKFSYVSPEQLGMFGGKIDGRSDIYSLGLVLAAAAQGEPLDMGLSPISVIEARRAVPDLSRVPAAVRTDLAAMLQPDPAKRPQSMREMIRQRDQRGAGSTPSKPSRQPLSKPTRALLGALAVLVVAGGAFGYWYWQNRSTVTETAETLPQPDNGTQPNGSGASPNVTLPQPDNGSGGSPNVTPPQPDSGTQPNGGNASPDGTADATPPQPDSGTQPDSGSASPNGTADAAPPDGGTQPSGGTTEAPQLVVLPPVRDVAKLREQAENAVRTLECAGVRVDVSDQGDIAASGYVGSEADRAKVVAALAALPKVGRVDNAIEVKTWPLCEVSSVLYGAAVDVGGPSAPRIDPGGPYHEGMDPLNLTVTPLRDGYLYVDYVDAANPDPKKRYVLHLLPSPLRDPNNYVKAGEPIVIGSLPKEKGYVFNPPLGANMVLVILSPQRLFQTERPQQEEDGDDAGTYLADLRTALTAVAQRSGPGKVLVGMSSLTFVKK
jgi:serine/threonine protein kinase